MHRHLKILEYALSSLLRRKSKNLAIIAVYAFTIAALASVLLLTHSLKTEAGLILAGAPELVVQRLSAGRHDLMPTELAGPIGRIPGVGRVEPRYWGYYYDALTDSNFTLLGIDSGPTGLELLDGHLPSGPGECAIGAGVAGVRGNRVGDEISLIDGRNIGVIYEIAGVFRARSSILTNDLIVLGKDDLIRFFNLPEGRATDISVQVFNPGEVNTVAGKIKKMFPDTRPITRSEIIRTYDAVFSWRSGMMLTIFCSALIAFCILAWDKATGISAEEKREVGILKAVGWDTADVLELKFWEGLVISLTSLLLGLIAAYVHVFYFGASILATVLKGWSVLFPPFRFVPYVDLYQLFVIAFLTVTPYVASTIIPSWKTAITDPDAVMRG
jgi:hypothetical protein